LELTAGDAKRYKIKFNSLDAIISVEYHVNSNKATQFRIWGAQVLEDYCGAIDKLLPVEKQIEKAISLSYLSQDEANQLHQAEKLRWEIIQVDEFDADLSKVQNPESL
jgi:hypothetical protein